MQVYFSLRKLWARALLMALAALLAAPGSLPAAVESTPELPNPGSVSVSKQEQEKLGLKVAGEVYQQMPVLPDSDRVTRYVQQIGKRLQRVIPKQYDWPYQFHVVQQKEINAFALPGGPIFVNLGTIDSAANEAQLAGVLAHEMAHVYMQHSIKQMQKNQVPNAIAGLGQILGQMIGGVGGAVASIGGQLGGGMLSMKYSRSDEAQADAVGAIIMYKAGYDPRQMAVFFETLEKQGGSGGPQFLSSHPDPGNRYEAVSREVRNWPPKHFSTDSPEFTQIRQQARSR
ncbi:MAG TPA: M48 family metallopeptidase, partial [Terriglobia bacterium]|nr:M48 family metallopeptidase [Terriglobia bacterium]